MRSILLHADASPAFEQRFQSALDIARAVEGHLTLHVNTPLQRLVAMDPFGGAYLAAEAVQVALASEETLIEALSARMAAEDVPWSIESSNAELVTSLADAAKLADLVIVANAGVGNSGAVPPGGLAIHCDAPVLAIPATADKPMGLIGGTAMVAWDGGQVSAAALKAAVPLLQLADNVLIVSVRNSDTSLLETDPLHYLAHYGLRPELIEQERTHPTIEETLEAVALERSADMVVMGAFGHSRLRETMFGGVSRYIIDGAKFPLLLAH